MRISDIIDNSSPIEDQLFHASNEAVEATYRYDMLYNMRNHVFAKMIKEEIDSHDKISKASAQLNVESSEEFKQYRSDMVDAKLNADKKRIIADYIKMVMFRQKEERKAESGSYSYNREYQNIIGDDEDDFVQENPEKDFGSSDIDATTEGFKL